MREVQDFDGAAALVGYVALARVEVDARGLFPVLIVSMTLLVAASITETVLSSLLVVQM